MCTEPLHKIQGSIQFVQAKVKDGAASGRQHTDDLRARRYVFKNLMRDWSQDGAAERSQSYGRMCKEVQEQFKDWSSEQPPKVLVPGTLSLAIPACCTALTILICTPAHNGRRQACTARHSLSCICTCCSHQHFASECALRVWDYDGRQLLAKELKGTFLHAVCLTNVLCVPGYWPCTPVLK